MSKLRHEDIMEKEKKRKKRAAVFAVCGGIALATILLIEAIWLSDSVRDGMRIVIAAGAMLEAFLILIYCSGKRVRVLLEQEKADGDRIRRERAAMENIQAALGSGPWSMEFDERGRMVSCMWTDVFRRMLGYEGEEDFPNRLESWSELLHEEDRDRVMKDYWDTVNDYTGKKTYDVKYRLRTLHMGWRWFHAAGRLSRREDGSPITFVGLFVDIDDEKKMEERLKKQTADLQDALNAAQHANRAKTTFLNNMSHDIRTPMNAIIGFTSLAVAHIDNPEQVRDYLSKIATSGNHLLNLINDVLDMSRIESGKIKIEEKEASLPEILHDLRTIVQADIASKQLELRIDMVDVVNENILCDRLRLNQILLNLLSNAVKFTEPGGVVSIRVMEKENAPKGCAAYEFRIEDTGIGMSPEFLKHVFEPFERERTSTVSGIQGTGLGMAITKNIVDMMGGSISVVSEEGKGTVFSVCLQFGICSGAEGNAAEAPSQEPEEEEAVLEENPSFEGKRIFLVEDNELNQEIAMEILRSVGFCVDVADDGAVAVEKLKEAGPGRYDLILMDVQMPVMNGYEATRHIRAMEDPWYAEVPIIAMTANAFEEDKRDALEAGMNGHVAKPIDVPKLLNLLKELLKN